MEHAQLRKDALDHYRRLVALLYREIGVLKAHNHDHAQKANKSDALFKESTRKQRAKDIYRVTLPQTDPQQIAAEYHKRSNLTLQDLHEAFEHGKWQDRSGRYWFGGPRWATIAQTTIALGNALQQEAWNNIPPLLATIKTLEHNTGRITQKYPQLD